VVYTLVRSSSHLERKTHPGDPGLPFGSIYTFAFKHLTKQSARNSAFSHEVLPMASRSINTEPITYGPTKFRLQDFAIAVGFVLVGIWLISSGHDPDLSSYRVFKTIFAGYLSIGCGVIGTIALILGKINRTPRITLTSTGITYHRSKRSILQAEWDSLSPFELILNNSGRPNLIRSQLIGPNVNERVEMNRAFVITFPKLIDRNPDFLVSEINDYRKMALNEIDNRSVASFR
jgi:hypothetical protein